MFLSVTTFPALRNGSEAEFRDWFRWSSSEYARQPGFLSRRLYRQRGGRGYVAIAEWQSQERFQAAMAAPLGGQVQSRVAPILAEPTASNLYRTMMDEGVDRGSGFVNIIHFPPVRQGKDTDFHAWFQWSSAEYALHPGFHRRRLLQPVEGGSYAGLVEHESFETFMAMHTSKTQAKARERVVPLLDGDPKPHFYELIR